MYVLFLLGLIFCSCEAREFPKDFMFGVATSAYQIEGAWNESGKGESIWDYSTHTFPEKNTDRSNGDVACDSYHKFDVDLKNLKDLRVNFYRFSVSWPRILPTGRSNIINEDGIRYYNEVIDKLLKNEIQPVITLFHWDLPQRLEEIGGWTNEETVELYVDFVRICYEKFGDRVKTWITLNEPWQYCQLGYGTGEFAPFIKTQDGLGSYLCGHNLLKGHAKAYRLYEKEFKAKQKGQVGITVEHTFYEPKSHSSLDIDAAERAMQMHFGWFVHPVFKGDYPKIMSERIDKLSKLQGFKKSRLPKFTKKEIKDLKGSSDFLGVNHYVTMLCENKEAEVNKEPSHDDDVGAYCFSDERWPKTARDEFRVVPWGLRKTLKWIKREYGNPRVIVTENGFAGFSNDGVNDLPRVDYYYNYIDAVLDAIHEDKCNVFGYTAWSFMDNFEWNEGYTLRFGLYHVDYTDPELKRTPKMSAFAYQNIIVTRKIDKSIKPTEFLH